MGLAANDSWTFTTLATTPPTITSINPADGATMVCPNEVVQAAFDDAMDTTTTIAANFTLSAPSGVAVDGVGNIYIANSGGNNIVEIPVIKGVLANASATALSIRVAVK